ncbi:hypothetical protein OXE08_004520 [Salmonella enterica]|nr:hypothetical protein [Salmonella enterica]
MMNQQQQFNPLAPEMGATADQMLNSYRQKAAAIRQQTPEAIPVSFNPYQAGQPTQQDNQDGHISQMEQFLSPIKMDHYDSAQAYTDEKHDNFLKNLESDPAQKEYGPQFHAVLESLLGAVKSGQISQEDAISEAQDYLQTVVKPIIKKHHDAGSLTAMHSKREPEIPEIIKKIRGGK